MNGIFYSPRQAGTTANSEESSSPPVSAPAPAPAPAPVVKQGGPWSASGFNSSVSASARPLSIQTPVNATAIPPAHSPVAVAAAVSSPIVSNATPTPVSAPAPVPAPAPAPVVEDDLLGFSSNQQSSGAASSNSNTSGMLNDLFSFGSSTPSYSTSSTTPIAVLSPVVSIPAQSSQSPVASGFDFLSPPSSSSGAVSFNLGASNSNNRNSSSSITSMMSDMNLSSIQRPVSVASMTNIPQPTTAFAGVTPYYFPSNNPTPSSVSTINSAAARPPTMSNSSAISGMGNVMMPSPMLARQDTSGSMSGSMSNSWAASPMMQPTSPMMTMPSNPYPMPMAGQMGGYGGMNSMAMPMMMSPMPQQPQQNSNMSSSAIGISGMNAMMLSMSNQQGSNSSSNQKKNDSSSKISFDAFSSL
jgi:hypothetical protein